MPPPPLAGSPLDAVRLYRLDPAEDDYQIIQNLFEGNWDHPKTSAQLQAIYAVRPAGDDPTLRRFSHCYPSYMGHRLECFVTHMEHTAAQEGSVEPSFRFHGTRRACLIGDEDPGPGCFLRTCRNGECNVCRILRNSFTLGSASSNSMFGRGIYSSTCSSKANIYSENHHIRSPVHAMLLCAVVTGGSATVYRADHDFDQIGGLIYRSAEAATTAQNGAVVYPETIVYTEDAIIPMGLVTYTRQGWVPRY